MIEDIRTQRVFKSIPIKVYEELTFNELFEVELQSAYQLAQQYTSDKPNRITIEWINKNGTNTPYAVSYI